MTGSVPELTESYCLAHVIFCKLVGFRDTGHHLTPFCQKWQFVASLDTDFHGNSQFWLPEPVKYPVLLGCQKPRAQVPIWKWLSKMALGEGCQKPGILRKREIRKRQFVASSDTDFHGNDCFVNKSRVLSIITVLVTTSRNPSTIRG